MSYKYERNPQDSFQPRQLAPKRHDDSLTNHIRKFESPQKENGFLRIKKNSYGNFSFRLFICFIPQKYIKFRFTMNLYDILSL